MIASSAAHNLINSHASWWQLAGLETMVGEAPVNWLATPPVAPAKKDDGPVASARTENTPPPPVRAMPNAPAVPVTIPLAPLAMPNEWAEFQSWLATDAAVPGTRWGKNRILPQGEQGARLMLLSLCPEMPDEDTGALHSGPPGALLDAMLRAIGQTRTDCYVASLALTRPPGGRVDESEWPDLTALLWHHLRLARPERLVIFGTDLARRIAATDVAAARGNLLLINQDGVKVEAVAIQHPLLLLDRPARKAAAWDSLKLLVQG